MIGTKRDLIQERPDIKMKDKVIQDYIQIDVNPAKIPRNFTVIHVVLIRLIIAPPVYQLRNEVLCVVTWK